MIYVKNLKLILSGEDIPEKLEADYQLFNEDDATSREVVECIDYALDLSKSLAQTWTEVYNQITNSL